MIDPNYDKITLTAVIKYHAKISCEILFIGARLVVFKIEWSTNYIILANLTSRHIFAYSFNPWTTLTRGHPNFNLFQKTLTTFNPKTLIYR